ncbi:MAG TPA: hypothetical protein VNO30_35170 [Kofleriaceae bacterium]|nr:hypothetical protein [Kofleriaceae bacterium]
MSPAENRLLAFVASRLESMLRRPAIWGSLLSVEERILQLLELRRVLLVPSLSADDTHQLLRSYSRFISETLDDATVEPLASQLEQRGRADEFAVFMRRFVERELAEFLVDIDRSEDPAIERAEHIETMDRILALMREEAIAHARRGSSSSLSGDPIALHDLLEQN